MLTLIVKLNAWQKTIRTIIVMVAEDRDDKAMFEVVVVGVIGVRQP